MKKTVHVPKPPFSTGWFCLSNLCEIPQNEGFSVPPVARQMLGLFDDWENDSEDGSDDSMMGTRIPYGFCKKDTAYILFQNDDNSLLFLDACIHLLLKESV